MRTFISINPDDQTMKTILAIQSELKEEISLIDKNLLKDIKWESTGKFHVTLFFIGETDKTLLENIDSGLRNIVSLNLNEIRLKSLCFDAFPKLKYPRVLILSLLNEDAKIFELSKEINKHLNSLDLKTEKVFRPHITLGRVRRDRHLNLSGINKNFQSGFEFSVKEFFLMESKLKSTGSEYSVINK